MSEEKGPLPPAYEESEKAAGASGVSASAPSINAAFVPDDGVCKPPSAPPTETLVESPRPSLMNLRSLTDEELRDACREYVSDHCCFGTRFIRDMIFTEIFNGCIFHYCLETFAEKRESVLRHEAFHGQFVDGPENGPPPAPWDMPATPPCNFIDNKATAEIPHTAYVTICGTCRGTGRVRCSSCSGMGTKRCSSCSGSGKRSNDERCFSCSGSGRKRCSTCSGRGKVDCSTCNGHGQLRNFQLLIVTWKNHKESFVSDSMTLPKPLVLEASGKEFIMEENLKVLPITNTIDEKINEASQFMVRKHETAFPNERILRQRQTLRGVPMTRGYYIWKKKKGEFYVYGYQKKVYFEDYPQKCCCCTCC